jgi:hypothetical protein
MLAAVVRPLTICSVQDDRTRPDEPDAAGHLRGDAGGVEDDMPLVEDVGEPEDRYHHVQRRAQRHKGVGPHPCGPLQPLALQPYQPAQDRRHHQAQNQLVRRYHPETTSTTGFFSDTPIFYTKVVKKSRRRTGHSNLEEYAFRAVS